MNEMLFQIMRYQILSSAKSGHVKHSSSYIHAWAFGVYPIFDEGADWHKPFSESFRVSEDMMSDLIKYLDVKWNHDQGTAPTFYEIEDHYMVRRGGDRWERGDLINAVRYCSLSRGRFSEKFFEEMLRDSQCPVESHGINDPFSLNDIYLE